MLLRIYINLRSFSCVLLFLIPSLFYYDVRKSVDLKEKRGEKIKEKGGKNEKPDREKRKSFSTRERERKRKTNKQFGGRERRKNRYAREENTRKKELE